MKQITLTRKQLLQMKQIVEHFTEVETFQLVEINTSGIGPTVHLKFTLFDSTATQMDITDISNW